MFLDDFMLFDVAKPITDTSHLEIEKSTLNGKAYQTGGGRTVDADVIDVLVTWMVNRDREFLRRRDDQGDQARHEEVSRTSLRRTRNCRAWRRRVELNAAPDKVWELIGAIRRRAGIP